MSKRLIYAEDAIDAVTSSVMEWDGMYIQDLNGRIREAIEQLPSAQPEKRTEERTKTHACDSISRQDTVDVIASMIAYHKTLDDAYWYVKSDAPSAQPDIIRCRNCKFASGDSRICMQFGHSPIGELDFCAWAERRTDE